MKRGRASRRLTAAWLLLALPVVAGARLSLDILAAPLSDPRVESQHAESCAPMHDHSFCTLLLRSPWSPRNPGNPITLAPAVSRLAIAAGVSRDNAGWAGPIVARSPPTRA